MNLLFCQLMLSMGWLAMAAALTSAGQQQQHDEQPESSWQTLAARVQQQWSSMQISSMQNQSSSSCNPWAAHANRIAAENAEKSDSDGLIDSDIDIAENEEANAVDLALVPALPAAGPGLSDSTLALSDQLVRTLIADHPSPVAASVFHAIISSWLQYASTSESPKSTCFDKLIAAVMENNTTAALPLTELAIKTDRNRRTLPSDLQLLASILIEVDRFLRAEAEKGIVANVPAPRRITYLEATCSDETPMPVVVADLPSQTELDDLAESLPLQDNEGCGVVKVAKVPPLPFQTSEPYMTGIKLYQSEQKYGLLVHLDDSNTYAIIMGETINWIQRIQATNHACIVNAEERVTAVSPAASSFKNQARSNCGDEAKANPLSERVLVRRRGSAWSGWRFGCEVHKCATAFTHTFALVEDDVSGMLNCALSVNFGSHLTTFRTLVKLHIRHHHAFIDKPAVDPEVVRFKAHMLRVFLQTGTKRAYRATLLAQLFPGNWQNPKAEILLKPGDDPDKKVAMVADGVAMALLGGKLHEFPRHRWRGADVSTSQIGLLLACHNLLEWVYPLFVESFGKRSKRATMPDVEELHVMPALVEGPGPAPVAAAAAVAAPAAADGNDEPDNHDDPVGQPAAAAPASDSANATAPPSAKDNQRFRTKALEFIQRGVLNTMFMMRLVMEPLRELLDRKLYIGSLRFNLHQDAAATNDPSARQTPLGIAAQNTSEDAFFRKLGQLSNPELWASLSKVTVNLQTLAFRLVSRAGCMVDQLLREPHKCSPFDCFLTLFDESQASKIAATPECLLHPAVKELVDKYGADFGNLESRAHLFLVALITRLDISNLESLHGLIRRLLKQRVQTHGLSMLDTNAAWCIRRHRSRAPRTTNAFGKRSAAAAQVSKDDSSAKPSKKRKTNSWNLFCRQVGTIMAGLTQRPSPCRVLQAHACSLGP